MFITNINYNLNELIEFFGSKNNIIFKYYNNNILKKIFINFTDWDDLKIIEPNINFIFIYKLSNYYNLFHGGYYYTKDDFYIYKNIKYYNIKLNNSKKYISNIIFKLLPNYDNF